MNYTLTSNHLPGSICIHPLNYLKLHLDFLSSLLNNKNRSLLYKEGKPLLYRKSFVKVNINVLKVRSDCVQPAVSLTTLFVTFSMTFPYNA